MNEYSYDNGAYYRTLMGEIRGEIVRYYRRD